jgi:hypothetical protein
MMIRWGGLRLAGPLIAAALLASAASAQVPGAIAAPGKTVVATMHAEGAQVYECKADAGGRLVWQFREPIATLLVDGKTVGRHYAGPSWEHVDGSAWSAGWRPARRAPPRRTSRGSGSRSPSAAGAACCRG